MNKYVALGGGSWISLPTYARAAFRLRCLPDSRFNSGGFRTVGFRVVFESDSSHRTLLRASQYWEDPTDDSLKEEYDDIPY